MESLNERFMPDATPITPPSDPTTPPAVTTPATPTGSTTVTTTLPPPPVVSNFLIAAVAGGLYEMTGDVTVNGVGAADMYVAFGGGPETLQGMSTMTDANGHFDVIVDFNEDGSDNGMATAQATDDYYQTSNLAMDYITI
ncbi:hypothetical protein FRUB_05152 [Fimbriiglobus ruber]|uniref:Uncharacterized protein n=2 Tax=Fimbriiglobus ruber TaxID=1908690 RepID=A0A225DGZ5_9BACT|nr:hypothetical protein FRUB_05152 [Fimbriiglobus ruber]